MRERRRYRMFPDAARGAVMALALAGGGACFDTMAGLTEVLSNQVLAPHDKLLFGCAESRTFADSPLIGTVGFEGPKRDRADVAVLVIPGYGPWTLQVRSVDNRQVPGECRPSEGGPAGTVEPASGNPPDGRPVQECLRVAVLPGQRVVRLSVSSKGYGSAWESTKVKGTRIEGTVVFPAQSGGLYSAHVCRPRKSEKPVFWIRDEQTRTCVSAACPPVEKPSGPSGVADSASAVTTQMPAPQVPGAIPGGCAEPRTKGSSDTGCYLSAIQAIERLPDEPVFWHLYSYLTRPAAEAAKSEASSTVVEAFGKVWLFTIAGAQWRAASGDRVAVIGPLPITRAGKYIARYMEATFPPNQAMRTTVHRHSGPEAWYVLTGAQCLRTPDHTSVLRAGEGGFVPPGPPMVLTSIGQETRRAFVLVLHDALEGWLTNTAEWAPTTECPP